MVFSGVLLVLVSLSRLRLAEPSYQLGLAFWGPKCVTLGAGQLVHPRAPTCTIF